MLHGRHARRRGRQRSGDKTTPPPQPFDSRTLKSIPESGERAAYDGAKRRKGGKVRIAVDTLGHLLALLPRRQVAERSFVWTTRFRHLVRDFERLPSALAGLHFLSFAILLLSRFVRLMVEGA